MQALCSFVDAFDQLHSEASKLTGLNDFGNDDYHEGMKQLLAAIDIDMDGRFIPGGKELVMGTIISYLTARLYTEDSWKKYPEYKNVAIKRPIFIVGLPRTGTTALHKLLSLDPQFQGVPLWLYNRPMPRPARERWDDYAEYRQCVNDIEQLHQLMPELLSIHDSSADTVDECFHGLSQNFASFATLSSHVQVPTYETWWLQQADNKGYRRYADILRLVGLNYPDQRWLLKNPSHLFRMDQVFEVFPDATIIQTHRDPAKVIGSCANLMNIVLKQVMGENVNPVRTGVHEAYRWLHALYKAEAVRREHEDRYLDVKQSDFLTGPMEIVEKVYAHIGLNLEDDVRQTMEHWLANQDQRQKGGHQYQIDDYGLSESQIRDLYIDYIEKYLKE